jgi:hypothetical protein
LEASGPSGLSFPFRPNIPARPLHGGTIFSHLPFFKGGDIEILKREMGRDFKILFSKK